MSTLLKNINVFARPSSACTTSGIDGTRTLKNYDACTNLPPSFIDKTVNTCPENFFNCSGLCAPVGTACLSKEMDLTDLKKLQIPFATPISKTVDLDKSLNKCPQQHPIILSNQNCGAFEFPVTGCANDNTFMCDNTVCIPNNSACVYAPSS